MSKNNVNSGLGLSFFVILSVISIAATAWFVLTNLPYDQTFDESKVSTVVGLLTAVLAFMGVKASQDSIEESWNQKVLSKVCVDTMTMLLASLVIITQWSNVSALAMLVSVFGLATSDIAIRQAMIRKKES